MVKLNGFKLDFETPANNTLILAAVWSVVKFYAPFTRSPILLGNYAGTEASELEQHDMIEAILVRVSSEVTIRILVEADNSYNDFAQKLFGFGKNMNDDENFYRLFHKKDKAIWFVDSIRSFERLKADFLNKRLYYDRNGFFCIVYTGREPNRYSILRTMFKELFKIFVININILVASKETVYVYTVFPYSPKKCSQTDPHLYDVFGPSTNYTFQQRKFFSKKLLNMWGCTVRVTTWDEPPFTMVKYNKRNGEFDRLEGIEGKLIMLLSERMNFTIQLIETPINRRGTGMENLLQDDKTDLVVSCLKYDKQRTDLFTPAYSYLSAPLILAVPKGHLMTPFERLIRPFKCITWICLGSSVLFGVLTIFLLKGLSNSRVQEFVFGKGNRRPFINFFNVLYGGTIPGRLPRRNFARYLLGVWILYTWIMRTAYTGQLFIILQDSSVRTTLNTIEEAVERNFTFYTVPILVDFMHDLTSNKINLDFLDMERNSRPNLFKWLGENENANAAVTVYAQMLHYYNQNLENYKRRINALSEPLFSTPITFYMQKNSYFAYEIHEILLNVMAAGLIKRFEDIYLKRFPVPKNQEPTPITLWLLFGIFSLYLCFLLLCALVFLLELWSRHSPSTKRIIDFFNF